MLFRSMICGSFSPDEITFVGLLSACSHGGLLEDGQYYFEAMRHVYNVKYEIEHYACMVDLLGQCGQLDKAVDLIKDMQ
jgi:pentatricopeptide repeat protein